MPDSIQLTATASSDVGPTPYYIRIYDDDSGAQLASCGSGTTCTTSVTTGWGANANPVDRHFHAEVNSSSVPDKSTSAPVTVAVQRFTFEVDLQADPNPVRVPDSINLRATTNRDVGSTPYYLRIIDDDSGATVASCGSGTTCQTAVSTGWGANENPADRHFHAEVSSSSYNAGRSAQVTVAVQRYTFDVSLASDRDVVQVPDGFKLTATTNRDVGSTPYYIRIYDDHTGGQVASCGSGTTCETTINPGWAPNADPSDRHFHAEVSSSTYVAGESGTVTVSFRRYLFAVGLEVSGEYTDDQGRRFYRSVVATTNRDVGPTPYYMRIRNSNGDSVASCGSGTRCEATNVPVDSYRATVEDSSGHEFGASGAGTVDLDALAALFAAKGLDPCTELALAPGTHVQRSTLNDAAVECEAAKAAGLSLKEILARVVAVGGSTVAWWLNYTTSIDVDDPPTNPPPPPPPPYHPEPPQTLPQTWDAPIAQTADALITLNPALELTTAREIAKRCLWLTAQAMLGVDECGRPRLPIFVTGFDVAEATDHDLEALAKNPSWMLLNYEDPSTKLNRRWYRTKPECADASQELGLDCDEFPFFSTQQGGSRAVPPPSLKVISAADNQEQGTKLYNFLYSPCAMRSGTPTARGNAIGGDRFIVLPIPSGVPTMGLCNGKSATNQP